MKSIRTARFKFKKTLDIPCHTHIVSPYFIALILFCGLVAIFELTVSNIIFNPIQAQIEITTDEKITPLIFNETKSEDAQPYQRF